MSTAPSQTAGTAAGPVTVLAGGVGAARYLRGVVRAVAPEQLDVIVNTGDDRTFYGVHVSPDLDIVTYTLADRIDPERGFGLVGDSFRIVDRLAQLGHETWFRLGDLDFAHCLHRTLRLAAGACLHEVADELRLDLEYLAHAVGHGAELDEARLDCVEVVLHVAAVALSAS